MTRDEGFSFVHLIVPAHALGWSNVNASSHTMLGWLPKNHLESNLKSDS